MRKLAGASILVLAAGCSTPGSGNLNSWKLCSGDFLREVADLAGPKAIDCGFLMLGFPQNRFGAIACAQQAINSGRPFKLGYGSFGDDSGSRTAIVQTATGELFLVSSEYALVTSNGAQQATWASKCQGITLARGSVDSRVAPFDATGCQPVQHEG
jgi:hypothetical protein